MPFHGLLSNQKMHVSCYYVKTLQGLGMLDVSRVAVGARVQWFNGSVVQKRV